MLETTGGSSVANKASKAGTALARRLGAKVLADSGRLSGA